MVSGVSLLKKSTTASISLDIPLVYSANLESLSGVVQRQEGRVRSSAVEAFLAFPQQIYECDWNTEDFGAMSSRTYPGPPSRLFLDMRIASPAFEEESILVSAQESSVYDILIPYWRRVQGHKKSPKAWGFRAL